MRITKHKQLLSKDYLLYDSNYVTFWKMQNNVQVVKILAGVRGEEGAEIQHREFGVGHQKYSL